MNIKKIIGILIALLFIFILNNKVYGAEISINIGETKELSISAYITGATYKQQHSAVSGTLKNTNPTAATVKLSSSNKKITITAKAEGTATITFETKANIHGYHESGKGTIKVTVIDPVKKQEDRVEEVTNTLEDMKTAYKNPPGKDASAEQINRFITSDLLNNEGKAFKNVSTDIKKAWLAEIESNMVDAISRNVYQPIRTAIYESISYGEIKSVTETIKESGEEAIAATEETLTKEKEYLALLMPDSGNDRKVSFYSDVITDYDIYKPGDLDYSSKNKVEKMAGTVLKVVSNIGMVASVLIVAVLGIKYMLGSVEDKAEYKQDLVPYFIGAVVLFGISTIVKILQSFGNSINGI